MCSLEARSGHLNEDDDVPMVRGHFGLKCEMALPACPVALMWPVSAVSTKVGLLPVSLNSPGTYQADLRGVLIFG
jgi:hypothetical protein